MTQIAALERRSRFRSTKDTKDTKSEFPCHLVTLSPCHLVTLSPCHLVTRIRCTANPLAITAAAPVPLAAVPGPCPFGV